MDTALNVIAAMLLHWKNNPVDFLLGILAGLVHLAIVTYVFWLLFVLCMNIQRVYEGKKAKGESFTVVQWMLAGPAIVVMLIVDVAFRYTYGMFLFFPYFRGFFKDITLSKMLEGILATPIMKGTPHYKMAKWLANNLINPFSYDGKHIRMPLEAGWTKA